MPVAAPSSCRYCIGCHGCRYCIGPDDCDEFCGCGPETDDETDDETDVWSGYEFFNDTPLHPDVVLQLGEVATDETPVKQVSVSSDVNGFPSYRSSELDDIIAVGTRIEPICSWWTTDEKRCLGVLKKHEGDIELCTFLLVE